MGAIAGCCLHYKAIILILPLLWKDMETAFFKIGDVSNLPGFRLTAPRSVTAQAGLCVHIPCTIELPVIYIFSSDTQGIWLKGNTLGMKSVAVKSGSEVSNRRVKFFLTGDVRRGDCSLMINDVSQQDADQYTFSVEDVNIRYTFSDYSTFLKVIELTEKPEISLVGSIVAGQKVTLSCTSPGKCSGKAPIITWEGKAKMKTEKVYSLHNEDGTTTHQSNITFSPSTGQLLFTCTVTFESNVTTSNNISLNVKDAAPTEISMPICRSVDSNIIAGMVVGNILFLILIIAGTYCFLKRHMEKRSLGYDYQSHDSRTQGKESTYQDLIGQSNDIYYNIKSQ